MKLREIKCLNLKYDQQQLYEFDIISKYRGKSIAIKGDKGAGKTSFLTAINNIFYMLNYQQERINHRIKIKELRARGFNHLKPLEHLIYNDDGKKHTIFNLGLGKIDYKAMKKEWFKNFFRAKKKKNNKIIFKEDYKQTKPYLFKYKDARMPNINTPFIHIPYGAILNTSEVVDRAYNSKDGDQEIDIDKLDFIQKIRHNQVTLIDETQMWERCQKWLRDTVDVLFYVKDRNDSFENDIRTKSTWTLWVYEGSKEIVQLGFDGISPFNKKELKNLKKSNENDIRSRIQVQELTFFGDIEKYYNSKSHEYEFCYELTQYEVENEHQIDIQNFTKSILDNEFNIEKQAVQRQIQADKEAKINKKVEDEEIKSKAKELYTQIKANIDNKCA